jgi:DNA-damage-inducible protein J
VGDLEKSTTYAWSFGVNQAHRSGIEHQQSIVSVHLTVSQSRYIIAQTEDLIMAHSTMLHVRVDDEIKTQASEALAAMGLSVSDAVRILLKRVVNDQAFPLELKVPNAQTRAAMEEARTMAKARTARFESADALIDDLEKARQQ